MLLLHNDRNDHYNNKILAPLFQEFNCYELFKNRNSNYLKLYSKLSNSISIYFSNNFTRIIKLRHKILF